jgi:hypothetical protein
LALADWPSPFSWNSSFPSSCTFKLKQQKANHPEIGQIYTIHNGIYICINIVQEQMHTHKNKQPKHKEERRGASAPVPPKTTTVTVKCPKQEQQKRKNANLGNAIFRMRKYAHFPPLEWDIPRTIKLYK